MYVEVWEDLCVLDACEGQKRASDPLEPELQVIVSHHVNAGDGTGVLCKSSQCF